MLGRLAAASVVLPSDLEVLGCVHTFEVGQPIVSGVRISMVDVTTFGNMPESSRPNVPMKLLPAARKVFFTRPKTVEATIEILRDGVKADWISEALVRLLADLHPSTVRNK